VRFIEEMIPMIDRGVSSTLILPPSPNPFLQRRKGYFPPPPPERGLGGEVKSSYILAHPYNFQ